MNNSVTTRQASELLDVHESSIKRWCNSSELPYWSTPGGHRRIKVGDLVEFAHKKGIQSALVKFDTHAERVWSGIESARENDFHELVDLLYEWIDDGRSRLPAQLLNYMEELGFERYRIFDNLVGPSMSVVGTRYGAASISVGDEHRMTQAMRSALLLLTDFGEARISNGSERPTAVVGCGPNEMHELGSLMTRLILEQKGWKVVYVGANMPTEDFAAQQVRFNAELVCISLMSPIAQPAAASLFKTLDMLAEPGSGYRLAIGGRSLENGYDLGVNGSNITDAVTFSKMSSFVDWLEGQTESAS